jgi:hypothetical protein
LISLSGIQSRFAGQNDQLRTGKAGRQFVRKFIKPRFVPGDAGEAQLKPVEIISIVQQTQLKAEKLLREVANPARLKSGKSAPRNIDPTVLPADKAGPAGIDKTPREAGVGVGIVDPAPQVNPVLSSALPLMMPRVRRCCGFSRQMFDDKPLMVALLGSTATPGVSDNWIGATSCAQAPPASAINAATMNLIFITTENGLARIVPASWRADFRESSKSWPADFCNSH